MTDELQQSIAVGESVVPSEHVVNFFGACGAPLYEHLEEVGVRWKRKDSGWHNQEPERDEYDFSDWDDRVAGADQHGITMLPILDYTALWASTAPDEPEGVSQRQHYPLAEEYVDDWSEYVRRFAERYPDIEYFEVWNEPNLDHFLHTGEQPNHEVYVERILEPAAEVLHDLDRKVVAPSFTTEWPADPWPDDERPSKVKWNVGANVDAIDRWLSYQDAWKHIDVLSVHYTKGDTKKHSLPYADDMMAFYDYVYDNYVATGMLEGIWNTEAGFTATQAGENSPFIALEPWEQEPYLQWVARYTIPLIHWGLQHDWTSRDAYKLFWYRMGTCDNALQPGMLVEETDDSLQLSDTGHALRTVIALLTDADEVGTYAGSAEVGFGIFEPSPQRTAPYRFPVYTFALDDRLFVAAWLDLPGLEIPDDEELPIQGVIEGYPATDIEVTTYDYLTGEETTVDRHERVDDRLHVSLPRTGDPILFFEVAPA
ncbi:hypothetical protein [Halomontanus rarus]|uniref:hypothetical protein n=1 Tax=Halomontanus rarus TaxID=3034020 RepID=UPI0023E77B2E|nr:hypothetical protein [Halovivax sp. TS33]